MKIVILSTICLVSLQFGCNSNKNLKISKMAGIMAEIHLVDAYAAIAYQSDTSVNYKNSLNKNMDTLQKYYGIIFANNGISENQFMANVKYYQSDAMLWDSLYSLTQKKLSDAKPILKNE